MIQTTFVPLLEHSLRERQRAIDLYCAQNREVYLGMAQMISPDVDNWTQVYSRVAFAILSANTKFESAVKALAHVNRNKGQVTRRELVKYTMTPAKADWVNAIPTGKAIFTLCRQHGETYHEQRLRLTRELYGTGLCKASFLTALLDPLNADVACIDTHMQKVYLGATSWRKVSMRDYLAMETKIREVGQRHLVSTFLAQWMIWDHVRGTVTSHAIFPGSHK